MMKATWTGLFVLAAAQGCAGTSGAPAVEPAPAAARSAAEGVYTAEQAERGEQVFDRICSACHSRNEFSGRMFEITWMAEPIGDLFQHISAAMPQDDPGSLAPDEYAAVIAYFLALNERPAGETELPADAVVLEGVRW
ncbi:MAG: cytochrome c [Gemmatimonadota bacterium]